MLKKRRMRDVSTPPIVVTEQNKEILESIFFMLIKLGSHRNDLS
jgi:hypothetical protein